MLINIDLEDGKEKVSLVINGEDAERFISFMNEANSYKKDLDICKNALKIIHKNEAISRRSCSSVAAEVLKIL